MFKPTIFLDKDGTLVENLPYNVDPRRIRLANRAPKALPRMHAAGYQLAVITNQSGVARGYFTEVDLQRMAKSLADMLFDKMGVPLAGFYYCPHHPDGVIAPYAIRCDCRKPKPGLLLRAVQELEADLERSWMIGDMLDDVEAGNRAGVRTILVAKKVETTWDPDPCRQPSFIVNDLVEAANAILGG